MRAHECVHTGTAVLRGLALIFLSISPRLCSYLRHRRGVQHSSSPWVWLSATLDTLSMDLRIAFYSLAIAVSKWIKKLRPKALSAAALVAAGHTTRA